ncbi:MAG: YihY/virulence factor BrkB family protein [Bryobacterales bacterium]|nr:YihY/virulence factor BrkB family protein [Bryobacterales bacterium]
MAGSLRSFLWLLRRAFVASYSDNILLYAKSASYSGLVCFLPLVGTIAAILLQANALKVSQLLAQLLGDLVPPGTQSLIFSQFDSTGERPYYLLVGASAISLWAASSVLASLMEGFDACYRIPVQRTFWQQRRMAIILVLVSGVPVILASSLIVFGEQVAALFMAQVAGPGAGTISGGVQLALTAGRNLVGFGTSILVTTCLYYFGPNKHVRWRDVFPGAMVATVLWYITVIAFAWYVQNIANYNVMYGSLGAGIALLVWMFAISVIALYGCEFNSELERIRTWAREHAAKQFEDTGSYSTAAPATSRREGR